MSNKKETAVGWLMKTLNSKYGNDDFIIAFINEIEKAKEMEKQQIIEAYWDGGQDIPLTENRCEQYYNETYEQ
jgi:disulfide oxidoreductase YuzD